MVLALAMTMLFAMPSGAFADGDVPTDGTDAAQTEQPADGTEEAASTTDDSATAGEQTGEGEQPADEGGEGEAPADNDGTVDGEPSVEGEGDSPETALLTDSTLGAIQPTTAVDPDTTNGWESVLTQDGQVSTQNIGRIWTDKSVFKDAYTFEGQLSGSVEKGNSDFLVALSALSSTSNLTETTTSTKPLDIVLVLDLSGSMNNSLSSSRQYTPVYADDVSTNGRTTYYAQREDGSYVEIERVTTGWLGQWFDHWELDGHKVEPMRSASDTQSGRIQFYTYQTVNQTKMDALKSAANQFIDSVGELNQNVTDENNLSRIAIVKYADDTYNYTIGDDTQGGRNDYNYTQVVSDFTSDTDGLKSDINGLEARGGTAADYGLTMAQHVLDGGQYGGWNSDTYQGARDDAQKVVIFFTDGEPNHGNGFDDDVAATSVNVAHAMKQAGTTVYTIGVLNGADPSADPTDRWTSDVNKYLHAVSSNYKDATAVNSRGNASWDNLNLGDRAQDKDGGNANYYYAAEDAAELDQVFEDITTSITESNGSGSPIQGTTQEGAQETPGNLTFTDQLGSYMEVTGTGEGVDKMQLAYADQLYTSDSRSEESFDGGTIYTYHFEGNVDGNAVYGSADLSSITVKVTHYDNAEQGDLVQVTIPASLIPLRNYDVNVDDHTMKVDEAYPIRLFYGVSLKQSAEDAIASGTGDVYNALVKSNGSTDGSTIDFYTNLYTSGNGDTTATFTPNEANKFYYYTSDTPLYTDEGCTVRATRNDIESGKTVYYQDTYYVQSGDGYEQKTDAVAIESTDLDYSKIRTNVQGQAYMPAHTQRGDRPATLNADKSSNETKTASTVLVPSWTGANEVSQALGNNGKMTYKAPGSLEIKKSVNWGNASDSTKQDKNSFTFKIDLTAPEGVTLADSYSYAVYGSGEDPVKTDTVVPGGTVTIAQDQRVVITGLPAGTTYKVTEQNANTSGFTVLDSSTGENANTSDGIVEGTIVAGSQQSVDYTNTYTAADVNLSTEATLQVKKSLTGRDWRDTDEFTFEIDGLANTAAGNIATPEPAETTIKIDDETADHTKAFGDITFTAPGEYRYSVVEDNDTNPIAGIDYSDAIYRVVVTVTDNGEGQLVVSDVKVQQTQNDAGSMGAQDEPVDVEGTTLTFTNNYNAKIGTTNINAVKNYTDTTGKNGIDHNKFAFQIEALGGYETDGGSSSSYSVPATDVPMPEGSNGTTKQVGNTGSQVNFGTISYDGNDVGKTFEYKVTELAHKADADSSVEQGMSYDKTEYTVQVKVEEVTEGTETHIIATVLGDYSDPNKLVFNNTYDPADAELKGDNAIHGTKVLTGRNMNQGETFYFQLTQTGGPATLDPDDDPNAYVQVLSASEYATVSQADGDMDFNFNDMKFSVVGTYTFQVKEVANENGDETTDGSGLTYDKNVCTVTVEVTDNHDGTMTATPTYSNQGHNEIDKAVFANTYKASMNYGANGAGGINVTKQMLDRPMTDGDFTFTITPEGEDTAYETFTNTAAEKDGTVTMKQLQNLTFDQDDAGKTFTYFVDESDPAEGEALPGVDYDQSQYKVEIAVYDNGDSTMHTVTTVTKIKDATGKDVNEVVVKDADSSVDGYTAPTFGFVNDYNPNEITVGGEDAKYPLQVTKTVKGAPSPEGVEYGFTLTPSEDYGDKVQGLTNGKLTAHTTGTIAESESQTVNFGKLTFTEPGTYVFNVQEDQPEADDGWTFDDVDGDGVTDTHQITVVVTDLNNKGEYDGNLYIQSITDAVQVTNSYHANEVTVGGKGAQQQITVQKTVTGADSTKNFKFQLTPIVDDTNTQEVWDNNVDLVDPEYDGTATINGGVTQAKAGTANFGGIIFKAEGTYQFNVNEVQPTDEEGQSKVPAGWTYDTHTSVVTVKVTDEGNDGQLDAEVTYDNSQATTDADKVCSTAAAFTNSYKPDETTTTDDTSVDTNILVTKQVTGAPATEAFKFTLNLAEGQSNASVFEGTGDDKTPFDGVEVTTSDNLTAGATETKAFAGVTFTAAGDYKFVIDETTTTNKAGWTYDDSTHEITVHVADQGAKLVITGIEDNNPTFTNSYTPNEVTTDGKNGLGKLQVTKVVTGAPATQEFNFALKLTSDNADGVLLGTGDNASAFPTDGITASTTGLTDKEGDDAHQTVDFSDLTFTKTGIYTFQVIETDAAKPDSGWTYGNGSGATITVTVTDDGFDGQLDATTKVTQGEGDEAIEVDTNNPTITNVYAPGSVTVGEGEASGPIQVTKNIEGTAPAPSDFSFTLMFDPDAQGNTGKAENIQGLTENEDGSLTLTTSVSQADLADNTQTANFAKLTFTATGDYYFTVAETTQATPNSGWTYDNSPKIVIVHVTDEGHDGQLDATVDDDAAVVTNIYKASEVTTDGQHGLDNLQVTKEVMGAPATEDFSFSLKLKSGDINNVKLGSGETEIAFPADGISAFTTGLTGKEGDEAKQTVSFGDMSFTAMGTYTFEVAETTTTQKDGWTYDNTPKTITVEVTDDDFDGQLDAKVTGDNPTFTNSYTAGSVTVGEGEASGPIQVTKNIEGTAPATEDFNFELTFDADAEGNTGKAENIEGLNDGKLTATVSKDSLADNTETVSFGDLTFKAEGEYYFTVTETTKAAENSGWTYDNTAKTVVVSVTDTDYDGHLEATVNDDAATVTNSYKASPVSTEGEGAIGNLQVTKEVTGNSTEKAFSFTATLTSGNAANVLTKDDDPTSTFPDDGITASTEVGFTDGQTKAANFGNLTFTAEGDYTFKVVENDQAPVNWTYATGDENAKTITIHVTDVDHDGKLEAAYDETNANNPTFTNTYKAEGELPGTSETEADLTVAKAIDGRNFQDGDAFTFTLTADGKNPADVTLPDNAGNLQIAYAEGDDTATKSANFGNIKFTLPGTYTFYVSEQQPAEGTDTKGVTYSTEQYTVTVEVKDAENGGLDAHITSIKNAAGKDVTTDEAGMVFTNTYKPTGTTDLPAEGEGSIQLQKVLTGKAWDGDEFTFQIAAADEASKAYMPERTEVTVSQKTGTGEDGHDFADFTFGPITYDQAGTYTYTVTEVPGTNAGMDYDDHSATVTVTVSDNKQGGFTAAATVQNGTFTNNYASSLDFGAEGQGGLWVQKSLANHDIAEGQFEFTVTAADQASADKAGFTDGLTKVVKSTAGTMVDDGTAVSMAEIFSDATFTQDDADDTYTYTVQETKGGDTDAGYTNDDTVYTVTITTVDDGQGGIKVSTHVTGTNGFDKTYVYDNDDSTDDTQAVVPFTNSYQAGGTLGGDAEGAVKINATKTLNGRPMKDGEFTFNVTDANGMPVATGTNDANGNVTFDAIPYTKESLLNDVESNAATYKQVDGKDTFTYQYTVSEDTTGLGDKGITGDKTSYSVTVTVTDNNNGTLTPVVTYPDGTTNGSLAFVNTYKMTEGKVTATIEGTKTLDGRNLKEGEFSFALYKDGVVDADHLIGEAKNGADGTFAFELTFDQDDLKDAAFGDDGARTKGFTYTVKEIDNNLGGVTYDLRKFPITVTVTDRDGKMTAEVGYPEDGIVVKNSYTQVEGTSTTFSIAKTLNGGQLNADDFSFEVIAANADFAPQYNADGSLKIAATAANTVPADGESTATFSTTDLKYDTNTLKDVEPNDQGVIERMFYYIVREAVPENTGNIHYDTTEYHVTVTVRDNGDGTMTATPNYPEGSNGVLAFTNSVIAKGSYQPVGFKTIVAEDGIGAKSFSFKVTPVDGTPGEETVGVVTVGGDAGYSNVPITFSSIAIDSVGTYRYAITEVDANEGGMTYDTDTVYYLTLDVTDAGNGTYNIVPTYTDANGTVIDQSQVKFTNTYEIGEGTSVSISAGKDLDGRALNDGEFGFRVTDDATGEVVATGVNDKDGNVVFGDIGYKYHVEEVTEPSGDETTEPESATDETVTDGNEAPGDTVDTVEPPVDQQQPADDGQQPENPDASGDESGNQPVDTTPDQPAENPGDTTDSDQQPVDQPSDTTDEPIVEEPPAVEAPVEEQPATEGSAPETDTAAAMLRDLLAPTVAVADDEGAEQFVSDAPVVSETGDQVDAATAPADEVVIGDVVDETTAPTAEATDAAAAEEAPATTTQLVSTDLGDHWYTIREIIPDGAQTDPVTGNVTYRGVTYDQGVYRVHVVVSDDGDGTMSAAVTEIVYVDRNGKQTGITLAGADGMDNVIFHNSYQLESDAATDVYLTGTKSLTGRVMNNGEFGFTVTNATTGNVVATGSNGVPNEDGVADINFGKLHYTKAGEYDYVVAEAFEAPEVAGVTYDQTKFNVHVSVVDNGEGGLAANVTYPEEGIAFANTYSTDGASVSVELEATKTLNGRDMAEGEFVFSVTDKATGDVVALGSNAAAANGEAAAIAFDKLQFTEVGEYDYTVSEGKNGLGGVDYDGRTFDVHVSVTDNGEGGLAADVAYPEGGIAFVNGYGTIEGASVTVTPEASKTLTGRDMVDGEFAFAVTDAATGSVVARGTNAADGTVAFDPIELTAKGDYEFVITEVNGRQSGMTYDDAAYRMLVTVSDDGEGGLVASVDYPDGLPRFANSYEEPAQPSDPGTTGPGGEPNGQVPKTGDDGNGLAGAAALALGGLGAVALGGAALLRRRAIRG